MVNKSAGILLYKNVDTIPYFFLVHPGGGFWAKKDLGVWSIPKGLVEENEDLQDAAIRETREELGIDIGIDKSKLKDLDVVKLKSGKDVHAWGYETDLGDIKVQSNTIYIEWPPKSGKQLEIPEIDRGEWFTADEAKVKLNPQQAPFIDRLLDQIK